MNPSLYLCRDDYIHILSEARNLFPPIRRPFALSIGNESFTTFVDEKNRIRFTLFKDQLNPKEGDAVVFSRVESGKLILRKSK